jgi:DNA-binding NtrC family response regulator
MTIEAVPPKTEVASAEPALIAVVHADPDERRHVRDLLLTAGYRTVEYESGRAAVQGNGNVPAVACVDLGLPDVDGVEVIRQLQRREPELSIIALAGADRPDAVAQALKAGAYDWVSKPLVPDLLLHAVRRARERRVLLGNVRRLESEMRACNVLDTIVGQSPSMRELARQVERALHSDLAVCVHGERGTEKELVARAIHAGSHRRHGLLVIMDCAAVPRARHHLELFGYEPGAFLGAAAPRRGRAEEARGGILYLEQFEQLSSVAQAGLVRLLEQGVIRRAGADRDIAVDVRVVATCHSEPEAEVAAGRLRSDLCARIAGYSLCVPPLRERKEDIPLLVGRLVRSQSPDGSRDARRVSPDVLDALAHHDWPGNVAELRDVIIRGLLACRGDEITLADVPAEIRRHAPAAPPDGSADDVGVPSSRRVVPLRELERRAIEGALRITGGSVGKAAKLLGIGRATLYRRLAAFGLQRRPDQLEH